MQAYFFIVGLPGGGTRARDLNDTNLLAAEVREEPEEQANGGA